MIEGFALKIMIVTCMCEIGQDTVLTSVNLMWNAIDMCKSQHTFGVVEGMLTSARYAQGVVQQVVQHSCNRMGLCYASRIMPTRMLPVLPNILHKMFHNFDLYHFCLLLPKYFKISHITGYLNM